MEEIFEMEGNNPNIRRRELQIITTKNTVYNLHCQLIRRFGDHKRDRFDSYGRMSSGYHRDRDRDRERGMHMNDKRRYVIIYITHK